MAMDALGEHCPISDHVDVIGGALAKPEPAPGGRTGQGHVRTDQTRCDASLLERLLMAGESVDATVNGDEDAVGEEPLTSSVAHAAAIEPLSCDETVV